MSESAPTVVYFLLNLLSGPVLVIPPNQKLSGVPNDLGVELGVELQMIGLDLSDFLHEGILHVEDPHHLILPENLKHLCNVTEVKL